MKASIYTWAPVKALISKSYPKMVHVYLSQPTTCDSYQYAHIDQYIILTDNEGSGKPAHMQWLATALAIRNTLVWM